jgi:nucleoside-diphosphate-sugar epimerase
MFGASSFLGFATLRALRDSGYQVRCLVSSMRQAAKIRALLPRGDSGLPVIRFLEVPDIMAPGALVGPMTNVDYIIHIASPMAVEASLAAYPGREETC